MRLTDSKIDPDTIQDAALDAMLVIDECREISFVQQMLYTARINKDARIAKEELAAFGRVLGPLTSINEALVLITNTPSQSVRAKRSMEAEARRRFKARGFDLDKFEQEYSKGVPRILLRHWRLIFNAAHKQRRLKISKRKSRNRPRSRSSKGEEFF